MNKRPVNINLLKIKLPLTALLSITHRVSGIIIFFLVLPVSVYALMELSHSQSSYNSITQLFDTNIVFKSFILMLILVFKYHIFTGVRHMLMDFHLISESLASSQRSSVITLILFLIDALLTVWMFI
ncbi:succinate dehydrogenase, cytochrome b556 subunit [Gammaproteobacteria bacterium]|nr:succinate dehydrogenase, cytochrome b556 subunit [Gammaproteobacteria bacterium]MDA7856717.1 succinate dehydrogenase, cytochrome b556 subunit [Gammaproteobacteria bacterium]MDA8696393.1 succinate dehydrogenase, cytochrome b556 subunit [Gammaproteobacteria bacterium]MDA9044690.1 succinate dehydrogenase, cytochrome b556 subunit [Gammaproteobacteria bacterium]MDA9195783.1 succinate dehydrogenase, cytochrome b556 subunit [Gammaproteobacteria bacterium]|tara:strand:- start:13577 stop:13957 length:381 start_codon:yes stop_codon:yes gene_type:complete